MTQRQVIPQEGRNGFEWPTMNNDHQRIAFNTNKYKDVSIVDAFTQEYGLKVNKQVKEQLANVVCKELNAGDVVELKILDITKKGVVFEQGVYKENIVSTTNLFQYPNFKKFIPKEPIKVKVMSRNHTTVYVDIFQPMIDEFIQKINWRIQNQANLESPILTKVCNLKHMRSGYTGDIRIDNVSDFVGKDMYMQAFVPGSQITLNIENDFEKWEGQSIDTFITNLAIKPGTTDITIACSAKEYLRFLGNRNSISLFSTYCEDRKGWDEQKQIVYDGNITGICRTQNKSGVFVEIPQLGITGMVPTPFNELTKFKPGACKVKIVGFDELMRYNKEVGQMQHVEPYKIDNGVLRKCNLKCTFDWAE